MHKKRIILMLIAMSFVSFLISCTSKNDNKEITYTITQYGDYEDQQHMFYTIVDSNNNLIIIDGGWDYEADKVREVIAQHNNHVKAWIVTHPHPDHTCAFNVIAANPDGISIDDIYVVNVDYERYKETAQWYDVFEACEAYMSVLEGLGNVHIVNENDIFYCLGLEFDVIHAWDDNVSHMEANLANNGSMCFIVSGREDRMLFMADTQVQVEDIIIENHLEELDVDYIQLGHHGNWGPTTKFYDHINPKAVFFDCPRYVFETEGYDASSLKAYFEDRGVDIYTFETQPNTIEFK
ncbi:MAG: MBL fold metallo-hydrolase [Lachnospiraceae bacterium]|nr:MBL fold metallo-hydrolase [Lachnospiraceae bacterium]